MAQSHIVEVVKGGHVHLVGASHRYLFRVAPGSPGDKLVGHQDIPLPPVHLRGLDGGGDRVGVAGDLLVREVSPHMGGLDKGEQMDVHRAVLIG